MSDDPSALPATLPAAATAAVPAPADDRLADRVAAVRAAIAEACRAAGRDPASVTLVGVSKTRSADEVRAIAALGVRDIGENYLDEAVAKQDRLGDLGLTWHSIGALQSNKTRAVAARFDWVHGVDRSRIAARLADARPPDRGPLRVLLQVNVDAEPTKAGIDPAGLPALADAVLALDGMALRGLMALPAPASAGGDPRRPFAALRACLDDLRRRHPGAPLDTLSMGMSDDFTAAIAEGATMVRIGTALFGPRPAAR